VLNKPTVDSLGFISSDGISINTTGVFDNVNVGTQTITLTHTYGGTVSNYAITNQATKPTANITPKALTISGTTVANKVYDGSTSVNSASIGSLSGLVGLETFEVKVNTATFDSPDVGNGKVVTVSYSLFNPANGERSTNYVLANTTTTANITKKTVTISGIVAADKQYDGTKNVLLIKPSVESLGFHTRDNIAITTVGLAEDENIGLQLVNLTQSYSGTVSNYTIINQTIKPIVAIKKIASSTPAESSKPVYIPLPTTAKPPMPPTQFEIKIFYAAQPSQGSDVKVINTNIPISQAANTKISDTQIVVGKSVPNVKINDEKIVIAQPTKNINASSNINFINSKNIKSDLVQADNGTTNKRILIDFFKSDTDNNPKTNIDNSSALSKANTIFKQSLKSFLNINLEEAE
jgi:hypothetical protein